MATVKTVEAVAAERKQPRPSEHEPTRAEIEERAYYLYVDRGRIDGFDGEDWHLAGNRAARASSQRFVNRTRSMEFVDRPTRHHAVFGG